MRLTSFISVLVVVVVGIAAFTIGHRNGTSGRDVGLIRSAMTAEEEPISATENFTRTGAVKDNDLFYYPGTEDLDPDEMRVTACGSGMPIPRMSQAAPCFLVELGNGDKFIFDIGTGATERLMSLQIPLDYINKVFIGHLHMDHMGDLPAFFLYGPQNGRITPLQVWGPGGGGSPAEWGMKTSMDHMQKTWAWMQDTLVGTIDTRAFELRVTEFDWSKVNNVIYNENGVVIRTIPAIHFEQSVSFILEWNGLKLAYSSDTVPNKWWAEHTKGADLSIHECFFTAPMFLKWYRFTPQEALNASTLIHTSAEMFGKIMAITQPKHAVAFHFSNDPDTLPLIVDAVRKTYSGPVDFAKDFMVWNVTKDGTRTRLGVANPNRYPLPPMGEKKMAEATDRYETPEWVTQGLEPDVLPVIQAIYDDFNEEYGTTIPNPLNR
jgi:ribonuclease Z